MLESHSSLKKKRKRSQETQRTGKIDFQMFMNTLSCTLDITEENLPAGIFDCTKGRSR